MINTFLLFLTLIQPVTPIDLDHIVNFEWRKIQDTTRIRIAYYYVDKYGLFAAASCLAGLAIEQPPNRYLPDCNASGLSPWSRRYPWGWKNYFKIAKVRPNGYFNAVEKATGNLIPFLSFTYYADNFLVTLVIFACRLIDNGQKYYEKWVGRNGCCYRFDELRDYYALELIRYRHTHK